MVERDSAPTHPLRVASYNVHDWVGRDRRRDPARTARVIAELEADVVALQEVDRLEVGSDLAEIARGLGMEWVGGPTPRPLAPLHGNALLTRLPLLHAERVDLTRAGRLARGALDVRVDLASRTGAPREGAEALPAALRVIATHLGLAARERRLQVAQLVARIGAAAPSREDGVADAPEPLVLLGDMNEWVRGIGSLLPLHRRLGRTPGAATFPSLWPWVPLDRIWVRPRESLLALRVHGSPLARVASDHLPIVAELDLRNADRRAVSRAARAGPRA